MQPTGERELFPVDGRRGEIDDDHFVITVLLHEGPELTELTTRIERQRPGVDPTELA